VLRIGDHLGDFDSSALGTTGADLSSPVILGVYAFGVAILWRIALVRIQ
jgi:hypothetical protein